MSDWYCEVCNWYFPAECAMGHELSATTQDDVNRKLEPIINKAEQFDQIHELIRFDLRKNETVFEGIQRIYNFWDNYDRDY